ncbi:MAG: phosphotransferase [Bacillota bacterium]
MEELLRLINREYGITVTAVKPVNSIWRLDTLNKSYLLKRVRSSPQRITQLAALILQLQKAGFQGLTPVLLTKTGSACLKTAAGNYLISPWIEGEKPAFNSRSRLKLVAACFGKLHSISKGLSFPPEMTAPDLLDDYQKKQLYLESLPSKLTELKTGNRIDRAISGWSAYFTAQSRFCLDQLLLRRDELLLLNKEKGFCHNDPAPGNIIIRNGNCYLIDYEFANCDLLIKEFACLLGRALQANQWEPEIVDLVSAAYESERPFSAAELKILPYLLCFPRRFWRICIQRYQEQLDWTEKRFQHRLWEIVHEEQARMRFLKTWLPELETYARPEFGGAG